MQIYLLWRQIGDYGDFFDFTQKDVEPLMELTKELIEVIKEKLKKKDETAGNNAHNVQPSYCRACACTVRCA